MKKLFLLLTLIPLCLLASELDDLLTASAEYGKLSERQLRQIVAYELAQLNGESMSNAVVSSAPYQALSERQLLMLQAYQLGQLQNLTGPTNGITSATGTNIAKYQAQIATNDLSDVLMEALLGPASSLNASNLSGTIPNLSMPSWVASGQDVVNATNILDASKLTGPVPKESLDGVDGSGLTGIGSASLNDGFGTNTTLIDGTFISGTFQSFTNSTGIGITNNVYGGVKHWGTNDVETRSGSLELASTVTAAAFIGDGSGLTGLAAGGVTAGSTLTNVTSVGGEQKDNAVWMEGLLAAQHLPSHMMPYRGIGNAVFLERFRTNATNVIRFGPSGYGTYASAVVAAITNSPEHTCVYLSNGVYNLGDSNLAIAANVMVCGESVSNVLLYTPLPSTKLGFADNAALGNVTFSNSAPVGNASYTAGIGNFDSTNRTGILLNNAIIMGREDAIRFNSSSNSVEFYNVAGLSRWDCVVSMGNFKLYNSWFYSDDTSGNAAMSGITAFRWQTGSVVADRCRFDTQVKVNAGAYSATPFCVDSAGEGDITAHLTDCEFWIQNTINDDDLCFTAFVESFNNDATVTLVRPGFVSDTNTLPLTHNTFGVVTNISALYRGQWNGSAIGWTP